MKTVEEDQTFDLESVESEECNENEQSESVPRQDEVQLEEETIKDCDSDGEDVDVPEEEEEKEDSTLPERDLLSGLSSTPRPGSGLGLILSNYWSSDEEL